MRRIARSLLGVVCGRRSKWLVLVAWLLVAAVAGPLSGKLASVQSNEPSSFLPGGAQSTRVLALAKRFPGGNITPAVVVYRRASGLTGADRARVGRDLQTIAARGLEGVGQPGPPIAARDGRAVLFSVPIRVGKDANLLNNDVKAIRAIVGQSASGLRVAVTGPAGFSADAIDVFSGIDTTLLVVTAALVAVLLLLIYRSPLVWLIPLISVGFAEVATRASGFGLAKAGLIVNGQTAGILTVLVFGAGTDYALLLTARYREELTRHHDPHEAMAAALGRASPAILASAGTVVCALLCLLLAQLNSNRGLGPIAAAGIAIVLCAMLTLLPALLLIAGRRVFWPFVPRPGQDPHAGAGAWAQIAERIASHPRRTWAAVAALLVLMACGLGDLHLGLSNLDGFRDQVDSVTGQQLIDQSFPAGASAPATVIVGPATRTNAALVAAARTPGVAGVGRLQRAGNLARFAVTLTSQPYGDAAYQTIDRLRERLPQAVGPGALVGGPSAEQLDANRSANRDTKLIVPLVLAVVLVILAVLLRALIAPLLLICTVMLSYAAALGVSVLVFDLVFHFHGLDNSLPLLSFVFLVALGVDYNIFLMARVREETIRAGNHTGVKRGLAVTGGVITSAGIVLAGTFSVLAILPLVALTEVGFIVAFGVLLDTLLVRSILVPALALDTGARIWWPSTLARPALPAE